MRVRHRALLAALPVLLAAAGVSPAAAAPAPRAVRAEAAAAVTVTGTYELLAKDMLGADGGIEHVYEHVVRSPGQLHRLRLPAGQRPPRRGARVRVTGTAPAPGRLDVTRVEELAAPAPRRLAPAATTSSATATTTTATTTPTGPATTLLVVLAYWTAPDSVTPARAREQIFVDDDNWFREVSYGLAGLTGAVTPWVKVSPPPNGECYTYGERLLEQATAKARALGATYDSYRYERTMLYFPRCSGADTAGVAGWAYEGGSTAWLNGHMDRRTSVHEQGHNFGMGHAESYSCTSGGVPVMLGGTCHVKQYGDPFDAMGQSSYVGHNSAYNKSQAGWLAGRRRTMTKASESFTLPPYERTSSLPLVVVVNSPVRGRSYWLEYRQPTGYDARLPAGATGGVLVHLVDKSVGELAYLLDASPSDRSFSTAVIKPGTTWSAPDGVRIGVVSASAGGASVTVSGARPEPAPPGVPRNVTAVAGDEFARLSWSPPAFDGWEPVTHYGVRVTAPDGAQRNLSFEATPATLSGLRNGVEYVVDVWAANTVGISDRVTLTVTPRQLFPSAAVTSPAAGAVVSGVVMLSSDLRPNPVSESPIAYVDYLVDGRSVAWDPYVPIEPVAWRSGEVADGPHELVAVTADRNGRVTRSAPVAFTVSNPAPAVAITSPAHGTTFDGDRLPVHVSAVPAEGSSSAVTDVYVEEVGYRSVGTRQVEGEFVGTWDVTYTSGTRRLVAVATDASGRVTRSAPVEVTVVHPPATVAVTSPAANATVSGGAVEITADAQTFAAGTSVRSVDFRVGERWIGADHTAPYGMTWDTSTSSGLYTVRAVVTETSGRQYTSSSVTVTVANSFPVVSIGTTRQQDPVPMTLRGLAYPARQGDPAVAAVEVRLDNALLATVTPDGGAWSVPWDATKQYGSHYLHVTAVSATGVRSTASGSFHVPRPVTTGEILAPAKDALLPGGSPVELSARAWAGLYDPERVTRICFSHTYSNTTYYYWSEQVAIGCADVDGDGVARYPWVASGLSGARTLHAVAHLSDGTLSAVATRPIRIARPPVAPSAVDVDPGADATITVEFPPSVSTEPVPILGYVVAAEPGGHEVRVPAAGRVTVPGLTNGVRYTVAVAAYNEVGTGPARTGVATPGTATTFVATSLSPSPATYGQTVTYSATLRAAVAQAEVVSHVPVELLACRAGGCTTYRSTTSGVGRVSFPLVAREFTKLTMTFRGEGRYTATRTVRDLRVRAKVTGALSAARVPAGTTVTLSGTVTPARYRGFVYLQRLQSGGWRNVTYRTQDTAGRVRVPVKMPRGTYTYRLWYGGTSTLIPGTTPNFTLTVT